jgi:hypothetical protein
MTMDTSPNAIERMTAVARIGLSVNSAETKSAVSMG